VATRGYHERSGIEEKHRCLGLPTAD